MLVVGAVWEGACRFVAAGRSCSPRELRLEVLVKLVGLLVFMSDMELFMCSLLKYAESVVALVEASAAVVSAGASDPLRCCLSLSLEWKGFESRHFERFSLSAAVSLLDGIVVEEGSTTLDSRGGTAGVSCWENRFPDTPRSRLGDCDNGRLFTSLRPPCCNGSLIVSYRVEG